MTDREDTPDDVESAVDEVDDDAPEVSIETEPYGSGSPGTPADPDDPFDSLPDAGDDDPFVEMDADLAALDDDVFETLGGDEDTTEATDLDVESDPEIERAAEGVVVPKRSYCERCQYFTDPPDVACENPGTTIHELTDVTHFRVSNCPVVADRGVGAPNE
ncbi:hypothetical protein [Halosegnis marinus]|uniref:DUF8135 domain-containing protein n=1 Tax=Halosegnis marinus TaxID=3034023 RepID=A0ABD5ZKR7_9EURY|nr:hypothetical protein [Halosegnis sp. DT85]